MLIPNWDKFKKGYVGPAWLVPSWDRERGGSIAKIYVRETFCLF